MPKRKEVKLTPQEQAQSVAYIAIAAAFVIAYLWAEAALSIRPHPYHWIAAFMVSSLIGGLAYGLALWQRKRRMRK